MPMTVSELSVKVSADTSAAESGLASLGSKLGSVGGTLATAFGGAAIGGIAALGAGLTASVSAASNFESSMSAIKAVSGATGAEMEQLKAKALDLGASTSFSASEAAGGIEELLKAGVSVGDVLGGGAAAALNLAAAGGIEVSEAATIASDAMNAFGISGDKAAHVADLLAGASVASSADVHGLGQGLAAVGAVAHAFGFSLDDTTTSLALMAQAGVKGSDAGTSLKTMLLNLTPQTKAQMAVAKQLGIVTADGANKFFDATGKAKGMADVAGILHEATKGLTEQQRAMAFQTLFGTDAIRAAIIMSEAGAEGYNKMAEAEAKIGADEVAKTRLDNLKGSLEALKGSLETAAIGLGTLLLPGLRAMVDGLTEGVNAGIGIIKRLPGAWEDVKQLFNEGSTDANLENLLMDLGLSEATVTKVDDWTARIGDSWRTMQQAFAGNWSPSDQIDPFVNSVGNAATAVAKLRDFIGEVAQKTRDMGTLDVLAGAVDHLGAAAATAWQDGEKLAAAIGRIGGAAGSNEQKVSAVAIALRTIATGVDLAVLNAGFLIDTFMTIARVAVDMGTAVLAAGKSLVAFATGDVALGREAARDFVTSIVDMQEAAQDWKTNTSAAFSAGMADVKNLVGSGSQAAAAEHKRAVDSMVTATEDSMGSMSVAAHAGMGEVVAAVESAAPAAVAAADSMGTGMTGALEAAGPAMSAAAQTGATGVVTAVEGQAPAATAAADAMGTGMAGGIEAAAPQMAAAAEQGASGAVAAVQGQQGAASAAGSSVGDSLGSGMQGGILAWVGSIASAAAQLVSSAIGAARAEADAHSPSRKTEQLGKDMAEGLDKGLASSKIGAEATAKIRDFIAASREYIPTAGNIARVEDEIKRIREDSQTDFLFRAKEMITVDSEALRLKREMAVAEKGLLSDRQGLARVGREIADIERGSLADRTAAINLGKLTAEQNQKITEQEREKIPLRQRELEIERLLLSEDPNGKRAKKLKEEQEEIRTKLGLIDNTIAQIRLQTRAQELDADSVKNAQTIASAASRIRQEELADRLRDQEKNTTAIKDQIEVLGAEQSVFQANEAIFKNATDNEIAYRNRLIAVLTAEGKPLADRVQAGLGLVAQLEKEGKISKELADKLRDVAKEAGVGSEKTATLGTAAQTAAPQMDAAARKAAEMAAQARAIAEAANAAKDEMSELAKEAAKYAREHGSLFDPRPRTDHRAMGGPVAAGHAYIVGERRPELFVPHSSGTILPSVPMARSGGGDTIVIDARGAVVYDGSKFEDLLVNALGRAGRRGRIVPVTRR